MNGKGLVVERRLLGGNAAVEGITYLGFGGGAFDGYLHWAVETVAALGDNRHLNNGGLNLGVDDAAEILRVVFHAVVGP